MPTVGCCCCCCWWWVTSCPAPHLPKRILGIHAAPPPATAVQGFLFPRFSGIKSVSVKLMGAVADFMVGLLRPACLHGAPGCEVEQVVAVLIGSSV